MHYWFWGMNLLWWFFWIALLVAFFSLATPMPRRRVRMYDHPLALLRRRYAAGEITTEEYEDRKARLLRDLEAPEPGSPARALHRTQERHA